MSKKVPWKWNWQYHNKTMQSKTLRISRDETDLFNKSHNAWNIPQSTILWQMCTHVHISVKIFCIEVYGSGALWDCEIGINDGVK